jgi:hypothetical protein
MRPALIVPHRGVIGMVTRRADHRRGADHEFSREKRPTNIDDRYAGERTPTLACIAPEASRLGRIRQQQMERIRLRDRDSGGVWP